MGSNDKTMALLQQHQQQQQQNQHHHQHQQQQSINQLESSVAQTLVGNHAQHQHQQQQHQQQQQTHQHTLDHITITSQNGDQSFQPIILSQGTTPHILLGNAGEVAIQPQQQQQQHTSHAEQLQTLGAEAIKTLQIGQVFQTVQGPNGEQHLVPVANQDFMQTAQLAQMTTQSTVQQLQPFNQAGILLKGAPTLVQAEQPQPQPENQNQKPMQTFQAGVVIPQTDNSISIPQQTFSKAEVVKPVDQIKKGPAVKTLHPGNKPGKKIDRCLLCIHIYF